MRTILIKKNRIARKEKAIILRFLQWQAIIAVILSVMVGIGWSFTAAISTMLGGLLIIIPTVFLAIYFFAGKNIGSPQKIIRACYLGEALKITSIAALLLLMLRCYDVKLAPLLIGFCGTYVVYFLACLKGAA